MFTRNEANALAEHMDNIEVSLMCELWNHILQRFNQCSKLLQSATIELTTAIGPLGSGSILKLLRRKICVLWAERFWPLWKQLLYRKSESETRRVPKPKKQFSEGTAADGMESIAEIWSKHF